MNRSTIILLVLIATQFTSCAFRNEKQNKPMNVVFFMVDDLGWRDVGCYGSSFYETPNIDQFAMEGVKFTSAYAACHVCSPTRASLLTGKYPASIHLTDWLSGRRDFPFQKLKNAEINHHIPYEELTLPEVLKGQAYSTAIIGKWHVGDDSASSRRQGFDSQLPEWNWGWPKNGYYFPYEMKGLEQGEEGEYLTDRMTEEALRYLEDHKEKPFFLYLSHFAVHDPIEGRPDLVEKYRLKKESESPATGRPYILEGKPGLGGPLQSTELLIALDEPQYSGYRVFPDQSVKIKQHQDNIQFAAMVESMDESLGRILNKLKELGIEENTLVIFYSDNGGMSAANFWDPERVIPDDILDKAYSTSNMPLRGGKGWLYEGGIRVPLIVKWPGQGAQGLVTDVPVITPDFFPTILEILGITGKSATSDGVSFAPLLQGAKTLDREAIYWHFPHYSNHGMQSPGGAVRSGDYKLLEYYESGRVQLFNLANDIGEQNDLADWEPEKAAELLNMLHTWKMQVGASQMKPNPDYIGSDK